MPGKELPITAAQTKLQGMNYPLQQRKPNYREWITHYSSANQTTGNELPITASHTKLQGMNYPLQQHKPNYREWITHYSSTNQITHRS